MSKKKKKREKRDLVLIPSLKELTVTRVDEHTLLIPKQYGMKTDGVIFASKEIETPLFEDKAILQVANVAYLPGIVGNSLGMPDIHWGYGFAIGGVAAFNAKDGVVSPGGIGYDINCGVRLLRTSLTLQEIKDKISKLIDTIFKLIPTGVGSERESPLVNKHTIDEVLLKGAQWAIENGLGKEEHLNFIEENGRMDFADPFAVSSKAKERGLYQLGTLGSGNHFIEINYVEKIFDEKVASIFGLEKEMICILIHTGSRGLGHQVCSEAVRVMQEVTEREGIMLPDIQLSCAPLYTREAKEYLGAMASAANFAFANREIIGFEVERAIHRELGKEIEIELIYDLAHNIAKWEEHIVGGKKEKLLVHRKGATRAFPAGHPLLPNKYKEVGQPVIIPGDMGRSSYILIGTPKAMEISFGSTCHGAGRLLSRAKAKKETTSEEIITELKKKGIIIKAASKGTIVEEMPEAYKDVELVVRSVEGAGISKKIVKLKPIAVIKG